MDFRIKTVPGTSPDGFPVPVFIIVDHRGEEIGSGWWYTWGEAAAELERYRKDDASD